MSTWGVAVVRDFRRAARAAPLAADERPVAVVPHGQPAAVVPHGRPVAVAAWTTGGGGGAWTTGGGGAWTTGGGGAAWTTGGGGAWTTGGGAEAAAVHEQLRAAGEPMVAAAGHGRPAPLGKARER